MNAPQRIAAKAEELKLSKREIASRIGLTPQSVHIMYKSYDCSVRRLRQYSEALGFNFFQEMADELNLEIPKASAEQKAQTELENLRIEIAALRREMELKDREIATLEKSISLLGVR